MPRRAERVSAGVALVGASTRPRTRSAAFSEKGHRPGAIPCRGGANYASPYGPPRGIAFHWIGRHRTIIEIEENHAIYGEERRGAVGGVTKKRTKSFAIEQGQSPFDGQREVETSAAWDLVHNNAVILILGHRSRGEIGHSSHARNRTALGPPQKGGGQIGNSGSCSRGPFSIRKGSSSDPWHRTNHRPAET